MRRSAAEAIRAQLIAAMEARASHLDGRTRRVLDDKLAAVRALPPEAGIDVTGDDTTATAPAAGALSGLIAPRNDDPSAERAAYPELPALDSFRSLWSGLRADSQLQQSVAQTPTGAGPLNSAALASRSIALMRALSPGYLRAFLAYVDDLAWLEQLGHAGAGTSQAPVRGRSRRKPDA